MPSDATETAAMKLFSNVSSMFVYDRARRDHSNDLPLYYALALLVLHLFAHGYFVALPDESGNIAR